MQIARLVSISILFFWVFVLPDAQASSWLAYCAVKSNGQSVSGQTFEVQAGHNQLTVICDGATELVFAFESGVLSKVLEHGASQRLRSAHYAYSTGPQYPALQLSIHAELDGQIPFKILPKEAFHAFEVKHTALLCLFAGGAFILCVCVFNLGRGMGDRTFYIYSGYIISACLFFFMQEGVLRLFFPWTEAYHTVSVQSLLAGMTVFFGVGFLSRLLDFSHILPPLLCKLLWLLAYSVLIIPVVSIPLEGPLKMQLLSGMGVLTSGVSLLNIIGNLLAIRQKVQAAILVLCCQLLLGGALAIRLYFIELSPDVARYGLIYGVLVEACILAFAVSLKIKRLDQKRRVAEVEAGMDTLCPVMNRRGWMQSVQLRIEQGRSISGVHLLVFLDLNKFKQVNDTLGHALGDKLLIEFASDLSTKIRESDLLGRLGGDEFVIFSSFANEYQAQQFVDKLTQRLAPRQVTIDNHQLVLATSIGFVTGNTRDADLQLLMDGADHAMYQHKWAKGATAA